MLQSFAVIACRDEATSGIFANLLSDSDNSHPVEIAESGSNAPVA